MNLEGKIAIVTGASRTKGIGAAVCRRLAKDGANIFFTYWSPYDESMTWGIEKDEPNKLMEEIRALGVRCEKYEADLSNPQSIPKLMNEVEAVLGKPDILVNNATYSVNDSYVTLTPESLDLHYAVNVRAVTLLCAEFSRRFSKGSGGRIINLTSGQSLGKMADELSYALTKGTTETLTYTLSSVLMEKGITINAVNPGPTDTGWMTEEIEEEIKVLFPKKRIGKPSDAAKLIAFLASNESEWITGQVIHSEGGFRG